MLKSTLWILSKVNGGLHPPLSQMFCFQKGYLLNTKLFFTKSKYSSFHDGIPDICLSGVEFVGLKLRLCKFDYKYQVYMMNAP